jgi:hypothetical protein
MDGTSVTLIHMRLHSSFWVFLQLILMNEYYSFYIKALKKSLLILETMDYDAVILVDVMSVSDTAVSYNNNLNTETMGYDAV